MLMDMSPRIVPGEASLALVTPHIDLAMFTESKPSTQTAIIGADMKTYGPVMAENVSSVPVENARIFVKQGLAEKVETGQA